MKNNKLLRYGGIAALILVALYAFTFFSNETRGYVDAVIPPSHTRGQIATALKLLERKMVNLPPKKHGNIPL